MSWVHIWNPTPLESSTFLFLPCHSNLFQFDIPALNMVVIFHLWFPNFVATWRDSSWCMLISFDHTSILGQNWGLSNSEKLHSEIRDFHISLSALLFLDKLICDMSSLKMICFVFFPHTSLFHGPQLLCSLPTTARLTLLFHWVSLNFRLFDITFPFFPSVWGL